MTWFSSHAAWLLPREKCRSAEDDAEATKWAAIAHGDIPRPDREYTTDYIYGGRMRFAWKSKRKYEKRPGERGKRMKPSDVSGGTGRGGGGSSWEEEKGRGRGEKQKEGSRSAETWLAPPGTVAFCDGCSTWWSCSGVFCFSFDLAYFSVPLQSPCTYVITQSDIAVLSSVPTHSSASS